MIVETTSSRQAWQSPDKQKTIWEVNVTDENGKVYPLKTYSEEIAKVGFKGEAETYQSAKGDRFIKQPQKEGGYKGGGNNAARLKADAKRQSEIRAEWAIAKAITTLGIFPLDDEALKQVKEVSVKLYDLVDTVISESTVKEVSA